MNILASGQVFDIQDFAEKLNLSLEEVELITRSVSNQSNLKMLDCKSGTVWIINAVLGEDETISLKQESGTFE